MDADRARFGFGIEAGNKPELLAALAIRGDVESLYHLQRLQGHALHPIRLARPEARQEGGRRRREARGSFRQILQVSQGRRRGADDLGDPCTPRCPRALANGPPAGDRKCGNFGLSTADLVAARNLLKERGPRALPAARSISSARLRTNLPDIGTIRNTSGGRLPEFTRD